MPRTGGLARGGLALLAAALIAARLADTTEVRVSHALAKGLCERESSLIQHVAGTTLKKDMLPTDAEAQIPSGQARPQLLTAALDRQPSNRTLAAALGWWPANKEAPEGRPSVAPAGNATGAHTVALVQSAHRAGHAGVLGPAAIVGLAIFSLGGIALVAAVYLGDHHLEGNKDSHHRGMGKGRPAPKPPSPSPSDKYAPSLHVRWEDQTAVTKSSRSLALPTCSQLDRFVELEHSLCPELIVPAANECTLMVPATLATPGGSWEADMEMTIDDLKHQPVLRVATGAGTGGKKNRRLSLMTGETPQAVSAYAEMTGTWPDAAFTISRPDGTFFAELSCARTAAPQGDGYILRPTVGGVMHLRCGVSIGQFSTSSINFADERGRLLAVSESRVRRTSRLLERHIRVGPFVDAGLAVLCLLGIDVLEASARRLSVQDVNPEPQVFHPGGAGS